MKLLYVAALLLLPFAASAAELPEQLRHLEDMEDEKEVVDAMRNYQLLQEALASWDSDLAAQYMEGTQRVLADTKAEDLRNRLKAIAAGWEYLMERYPNNPRVNNYYGEYLYDHTRDQDGAVRLWLQAVATDPDFGPAHNNLGVHYLHNGSVRLGLQHLHTAIELDPAHPDYLFNITQAYLNYRREVQRWYGHDMKKIYASAMDFSRRAAEAAPNDLEIVQDYATNFYAAENFGVTPDWKQAALAWDSAIAASSDSLERHFATLNKARVMIRMEKFPEAITLLESSLELVPDSEAAANLLAQCREEVNSDGKQRREKKKAQ